MGNYRYLIFDFLIIITLGAVVGADIADPTIKHFPTDERSIDIPPILH